MKNKPFKTAVLFAVLFQFHSITLEAATFPEDKLPSYIKMVSDYGERCEWSKDAKKILYVTRSNGDVEEVTIETGEVRVIAKKEGNTGYWRAYNLINGDYALLRGSRRGNTKLVIVSQDLSKETVIQDVTVKEGAAVSRRNMKIAWMSNWSEIYVADIVYTDGTPDLVNRKEVVGGDNRPGNRNEPQDFKGDAEKELIFTCYDCGRHEIYGVDLETGDVTNYSNAGGTKEEPEGIFPSGKQTLMESDKETSPGCGDQCIEVYALLLDGTGENWERMTFFHDEQDNDGNHWKASNPAVRNNGRQFCFQEAIEGAAAGVGQGIYIYDLEEAGYQWLALEDGAAIPPDTIADETSVAKPLSSKAVSMHQGLKRHNSGIAVGVGKTGLVNIQGRKLINKGSGHESCADIK